MMNPKYLLASLFPRTLVINIKYMKQSITRFIHKKKLIETKADLSIITKPLKHVFFGYYDVCPFNDMTDEVVYHSLAKGSAIIDIMLSSLNHIDKDVMIANSSAWSWQQGSRLRWMPGNNRTIIFNDYQRGEYLARIINIDDKCERKICAPLYDISHDGKVGLSVDFERLESKRPGYGYSCRPYTENGKDLANEGIDLVDIETNTKTRLITYEKIAKVCGNNDIDYSNAYINHISFSPSDNKFLFFWIVIEGSKHKASLLVYDFASNRITPVETDDVVSHYVWDGDEKIICTAYNINSKCNYFEYSLLDGKKLQLNAEYLNEDGHPSIFNGEMILSDTYPNLDGYQKLFLAGKKSNKRELLNIYSNCKKEGEQRTDLHPRLNNKKDLVCFDANVKGYRMLYFMKIKHEY